VRRHWAAARLRLFEALKAVLPPPEGRMTIDSLEIRAE
jgi:hypothetical protein